MFEKILFQNEYNIHYAAKFAKYPNQKIKITCPIETDIILGNLYRIHSHIKPIYPNNNPSCFDYNAYLLSNNITKSSYSKNPKPIDQSPHLIDQLQYQYPAKIEARINKYIKQPEWIKALLLGKKSSLNKEQKEKIQQLGINHLMAISGMHIGLIYLLIHYLLIPLKWINNGVLHSYICILSIWLFTFICGLPPSAVRASIMISFLLLGKQHRKDIHAVNLLCCSGFVILILKPQDLFSISFQFSFLAVWALITIPQYILPNIKSNYRWIQKMIEGLRISISIQIFLLPIQIFYFENFSIGGPLFNIIFTPISAILLYLSSAFLFIENEFILENMAIIINFINKIFYMLIDFCSTIDLIFLGPYFPKLLWSIVFTISIAMLVYIKKLRWYSSLVCIGLFFLSMKLPSMTKDHLYIFSSKPNLIIEYSNQNKSYLILGKNTNEFGKKMIETSQLKRGIEVDSFYTINHYKQNDYFIYHSDTIQIYDKKIWWYQKPRQNAYIYIRNNPFIDKDQWKKAKVKYIITDPSCTEKYQNFIFLFCKENNIEHWNMTKQGAFILE